MWLTFLIRVYHYHSTTYFYFLSSFSLAHCIAPILHFISGFTVIIKLFHEMSDTDCELILLSMYEQYFHVNFHLRNLRRRIDQFFMSNPFILLSIFLELSIFILEKINLARTVPCRTR